MNIELNKLNWQSEWPTEAGYYLFWGYRFRQSEKKELCLLKVRINDNGHRFYIANDNFIYPEGSRAVLFSRIDGDLE